MLADDDGTDPPNGITLSLTVDGATHSISMQVSDDGHYLMQPGVLEGLAAALRNGMREILPPHLLPQPPEDL